MEWKPFETAPKDGRKILAWSIYLGWPEVIFWDGYFWRYADVVIDAEMVMCDWSHWAEIVPPPEND